MLNLRFYSIVFYFLLSFSTLANSANEIPRFTPNVVDENQYLSSVEKLKINQLIKIIQQEYRVFPAVYIFPSLNKIPIESIAVSAFEEWQLGEKGKDNGILILLAMEDRKARIEVGYGLEGAISDLRAKEILNQILIPKIKEGKLSMGLIDSLNRIADYSSGEFEESFKISFESIKAVYLKDGFTGVFDKLFEDPRAEKAMQYFLWYLVLVIIFPFFISNITEVLALKVSQQLPDYDYNKDPRFYSNNLGSLSKIGVPIFLFFNPGIFVLVLYFYYPEIVFYSLLALTCIMTFNLIRRYQVFKSAKAYAAYAKKQQIRNTLAVEKGLLKEFTLGSFHTLDTPSNFEEFRELRRHLKRYGRGRFGKDTMKSSGGFDSSSSGGRSGGGGASSDW